MKIINQTTMQAGWIIGHVPPHPLSASLVLKGTFRIVPDGVAELAGADDQRYLDGDQLEFEDAHSAIRYPVDLAPIKPACDALLVGTAHAPGGSASVMQVSFGLGSFLRALLVTGPRVAASADGPPPEPLPFTSVPLDWRHAYGGPECAANPDGTGDSREVDETGQAVYRFPQVIDRMAAGKSLGKLRDPAGFGPLSPDWPQRMNKVRRATWGNGWLQSTWPAYPPDFDYSYFNAAPDAQQIPYPAGDELFWFDGLRPDAARVSCQLPGLRPRWFLDRSWEGEEEFREVPLVIDTVWIDTDAMTLVVCWRGITALADKRMRDVRTHVIGLESMADEPKPEAEYKPEAIEPPADPDAPTPEEEALEESAMERPEFAEPEDWEAWEQGFDDEVQSLLDQAEAQKAQFEAQIPDLGEELATSGFDPAMAPNIDPAAAAPMSVPGFLDEMVKGAEQVAAVDPDLAQWSDFGVSEETFESAPELVEMEAEIEEKQAAFDEMMAEHEKGFEDMRADSGWTREGVEAHHAAGESFEEEDLTGLDLSGLDLSGADFTGAVLQGVNFTGAILSGCRFEAALLPSAILDQAVATECDFSLVDFTAASLRDVRFDGSGFIATEFTRAIIIGTSFDHCLLESASFHLTEVERASFIETDLDSSRFEAAQLRDLDWSTASLGGVAIRESTVVNVRFDGATMNGFRAGNGAVFQQCSCVGVQGDESVWEEAVLDGTDFSSSSFVRASFTDASLRSCDLREANFSHARLFASDLTGARLAGANLFQASLEEARLAEADFTMASLYEAEFLDARVEDSTSFIGANLKGTKLG